MSEPGSVLTYMDCNRTAEMLRLAMRRYRDAYVEEFQALPDAPAIAGAMLLALREGATNAGALTAMHIGLMQLAGEVLGEVHH